MNHYGLRRPRGQYGGKTTSQEWDFFRSRLAVLQNSAGSQEVIRQRRDHKIAPPLYADPTEKAKRRQKNRARRARRSS